MTARNNSKGVTFFKSVSEFDNVLRVSQMLIKEDTPSSIIYQELVSVLPSLPGFRFSFRIPAFPYARCNCQEKVFLISVIFNCLFEGVLASERTKMVENWLMTFSRLHVPD